MERAERILVEHNIVQNDKDATGGTREYEMPELQR